MSVGSINSPNSPKQVGIKNDDLNMSLLIENPPVLPMLPNPLLTSPYVVGISTVEKKRETGHSD